MPYKVNHIHIKSKNPKKTAEWFVKDECKNYV